MVKSSKLYSPQRYLEIITGKCYVIAGGNDVETVEKIIEEECEEAYWTHSLEEIGYIVENDLNVILVDYLIYNEGKKEFEHVYRWSEVPEDFVDEEEKK